jgi:uncharacterized protein YfaA (DUF2138 family)
MTKTPPMTPERVIATGKQFGQKIGRKEAKAIARVLAPRPWDRVATNRPGDQAAIFAEEEGIDYATALRMCNMD